MFIEITMLTQLYAKVGILFTCGKHLHDHIISQRGHAHVWTKQNPTTFYWTACKAGLCICAEGYQIYLFLWLFYWILELLYFIFILLHNTHKNINNIFL